MNKVVKNIPNCITALNLAAGCLAIIAASNATKPFWGLVGFQWAFLFMAMAAIADFLDGLMARILNAYSNLGKELDSLSDLVSFGVAPALTLFFLLQEIGPEPWLSWVCLLIPVCAAFRLAKFNLDSRQAFSFIGLPVPANAIFWIGFANLIYEGVNFLSVWYVLIPFIVVEGWLMNSNIPMFSLKIKSWGLKENFPRYLLILGAAIFCFSLGVSGLFWLILLYVLLSIAFRPKTSNIP
ncbi:MAG: CDP-diacylglycerol--serine O-phosphatidyltransferase [Muribaculaceae bacterium]|nr:CDP-diacylglycerol--serine O-phosphatidyltransferase [Muribaculaceae bacterium]